MTEALKIIVPIALVFTALCIGCAVWIGRRRPPAADPFSLPFGEMPFFEQEQLRRLAPGVDEDCLYRAFAARARLKREAQALLLIPQSNSTGAAMVRVDNAGGEGPSQSPRRVAARNFLSLLGVRRHV